jgi:hypothetical protein
MMQVVRYQTHGYTQFLFQLYTFRYLDHITKSVSAKMGIQAGVSAIFINAPADVINAIDPPDLKLSSTLSGDFDYIHLFANDQAVLHEKFSKLKDHLKATGSLWVSWPKAGKLGTDLNLPIVIKIGYDYGLVESKCLSVNDTWSALKFTHPKKGKIYNNSYGKLKK